MSSFELRFGSGDAEDGFSPLVALYGGGGSEELRPATTVFPDFAAPGNAAAVPSSAAPAPGVDGADAEEAAREAASLAREAELADAHARGFAEGQAAERAELESAARGCAEAAEALHRFRSDLVDRYQSELLDIAVAVARKVIGEELAASPEHWLAMVREGVQRSLDRERIRIRVGSALHHLLMSQIKALRVQLDDVKDLELVEEVSLAPHACVIETAYGELDVTVDSQLAAIRAALNDPA